MKGSNLFVFLLTLVLAQVFEGSSMEYKYKVKVKTGDCWTCGTGDHVYLKIIGKYGKTGEHKIKTDDGFDSDSEITYTVTDTKFVGDFIAVEIIKRPSSFTGVGNGWSLEWMKISHGDGTVFKFKYGHKVPDKKWFKIYVTCPDGFQKISHEGYCKDVDECKDGKSCVGAHSQCSNTIGSFRCTCLHGYKLSNGRCIDTDECIRKPCDHICENYDGGYKCDCHSGYKLVGHGKCENINECETNNPCSPVNTCVDEVGSYRCQCPTGYYNSDKNTCSDIDECKYSTSCDPGISKCVNLPGDYKCECLQGFESVTSYKCQDKDECSGDNSCDLSASTCVNTVGKYNCKCKLGYHQGSTNLICKPDLCGPLAVVTGGSFEPKARCSVDRASRYGDVCSLVCHNGYDISEPANKNLTCGPYGSWTGKQAVCVPKLCPALTKPANGGLFPSNCETDGGTYPRNCSYFCLNGFRLKGQVRRSCQADGTWSGASATCIKEFAKPWIQCPSNIIKNLKDGQNTTNVGSDWKMPNHNTQSLTVEPKGVDSTYRFPVGSTIVRWTASNPAGNASCEIYVIVYDRQPPKVDFCPNKVFATIDSSKATASISWSEPRFSDNVGVDKVTSTHTSGQSFMPGSYNIYYTAEDLSGNRAQCQFEVQLKRIGCSPLKGPINGQRKCFLVIQQKICTVTCTKGTMVYNNPATFGYWYCNKGVWSPTDVIPDCVVAKPYDGVTGCPSGSVKMKVTHRLKNDTFYCAQCPTGTHYAKSSRQCNECTAGSYNDMHGSMICKPCPFGRGSFSGAKSLKECLSYCSAGSYSSTGFGPTCTLCPLDTYSVMNGSKHCTKCPEGTFTVHRGATYAGACGKKPNITRIVPASSSITEGEDIEFSCFVSALPEPVIKWKFLRTHIPDSFLGKESRSLIKDKSGKIIGMKLLITGAKIENTGSYECSAHNTHGSSRALSTLTVDQASGSGRGALI